MMIASATGSFGSASWLVASTSSSSGCPAAISVRSGCGAGSTAITLAPARSAQASISLVDLPWKAPTSTTVRAAIASRQPNRTSARFESDAAFSSGSVGKRLAGTRVAQSRVRAVPGDDPDAPGLTADPEGTEPVEPPPVHEDAQHPHQEFFEPWRAARELRYADRPQRRLLKRRRKAAVMTIVHNEPVFLPLWLRYYSRFFAPATSTCSTTTPPTARPTGDGFVRDPGRHDTRRPHLDGAIRSRAPARAARALRRGAGHRRRRDRRPRSGMGHARRVHRPLRRGVRQLPRLRAAAPAGSRAAARPRAGRSSTSAATGSPTTATTSRRSRRCRWSGCRASTDAPTAVEPRSRPAPDPPAPHGLRALPRPPPQPGERSRGRATTSRGWAVLQPDRRGAEFERWFYEETGFDERGIHVEPERIPHWRGLF